MPLGLFKKLGNYRWTGGLGAEPPAGSRGSALVGVQGGEAPLKLELFLNQNCPESHQLTRMVVTHVYNTCTGERKKEERKKKGKKKVGRSEKVGKTASLFITVSTRIHLHKSFQFVLARSGAHAHQAEWTLREGKTNRPNNLHPVL